MRTKKLLLMICVCLAMGTMTAQAVITDVSVLPENPTDIDLISILVTGEEGSGGVTITDAIFTLDDDLLTLDISLDIGNILIVTPWDYTYDIGLLPEGIYDLTVNSLVPVDPTLNDTFMTAFEVVPEPATAFLFGSGVVFVLIKKHERKKLNR